jgi:hypothetical protein
MHAADFQRLDGPAVQDESQRFEDLTAWVRGNGNLKLQRGGIGYFDFDLGAHFTFHNAILRQSLWIRQACDGIDPGGVPLAKSCRQT